MKIRTITTGFHFHPQFNEHDFDNIASLTKKAKEWFQQKGYQVQTIRISTQPWESYVTTKQELQTITSLFEHWISQHTIDYFNIGPCKQKEHISWIPYLLKNCKKGFSTVHICNNTEIFYDNIKETAKTMKTIADLEPQGFANLRFAALCNIKPHTPFYPASYHQGKNPSFGIGLENSDLVYKAFSSAGSIITAKEALYQLLTKIYKPIEKHALGFSDQYGLQYCGLDTSVSTSIDKNESIAYAFEKLIKGYKFGQQGTLSIARIITDTIQSIPVQKTGYCGLMLPVLEDDGLSTRNKEHQFSISDLLLYSAVCGTGLDTIPLPGNITERQLYNILLDVASLSIKLQKPLSARLMPIPGKKAGDMTEFNFSYFKNSSVMKY
jgi:uncharacterized protein